MKFTPKKVGKLGKPLNIYTNLPTYLKTNKKIVVSRYTLKSVCVPTYNYKLVFYQLLPTFTNYQLYENYFILTGK